MENIGGGVGGDWREVDSLSHGGSKTLVLGLRGEESGGGDVCNCRAAVSS